MVIPVPSTAGQTVLSDHDRACLDGDLGNGTAMAMRVVLPVATAVRAPRLVDIESAHVDGCFYVGPVSIDFARALAEGGARVSVPKSLYVSSVDLVHPQNWHGGADLAANAPTLMGLYTELGCDPTWTCARFASRSGARSKSPASQTHWRPQAFASSPTRVRTTHR